LIILGLDPGSRVTGYGVVQRSGSRLTALAEGLIPLDPDLPMAERLARLSAEIECLVDRTSPDAAVLESTFHGRSSRSLIVLAQARGAILAVLGRRSLPVAEYAPAEVKVAVTGNGRADKRQVARMVDLLLGVRSRRAGSSDATDALAAALCYAQRFRIDGLRANPGALGRAAGRAASEG
jgi:crossover junction endodeoxyribonuclease RuvC